MSGYAQPVLASQGRLGRDVHLIEKPFSAATLIAEAGQVLSGRSREGRLTPADKAPRVTAAGDAGPARTGADPAE